MTLHFLDSTAIRVRNVDLPAQQEELHDLSYHTYLRRTRMSISVRTRAPSRPMIPSGAQRAHAVPGRVAGARSKSSPTAGFYRLAHSAKSARFVPVKLTLRSRTDSLQVSYGDLICGKKRGRIVAAHGH
jgi:hypothetical protein